MLLIKTLFELLVKSWVNTQQHGNISLSVGMLNTNGRDFESKFQT